MHVLQFLSQRRFSWESGGEISILPDRAARENVGDIALETPHNRRQSRWSERSQDQMHVIWHDDIAIELEILSLSEELKRIKNRGCRIMIREQRLTMKSVRGHKECDIRYLAILRLVHLITVVRP
ncbi:MAG: hypothetical protein PHI18_02250 [bacterium]|nr:hypothetical protein [bacterium]